MGDLIGVNYSVKIISIDGADIDLNAMLCINEKHEVTVEIYSLPMEQMKDIYNSYFIKHVVAETTEKKYITIFDSHIIDTSSNAMQEQREFSITIKSSRAIIGSSAITPNETFRSFIIKVTDGCELIGICPYDIKPEDIDIFGQKTEFKIPIDYNEICAETTLGKWQFIVYATKEFSKDKLSLGFEHQIYFDSNTPITYIEFRKIFDKIASFFEILCGELVTVNELRLYDGEDIDDLSKFREFRCIGYANYPLENLRWLNKAKNDSVGYLRGAIFKVTDFSDIPKALNDWFIIHEKTPLATGAYQRILLDEDVEIITENRFLAAMQLIEGYTAEYSDYQVEIKEFNARKNKLKESAADEDDKDFIDKYCTYSGETFRKMLKSFTCEGLVDIQLYHSKQMFLYKIDKILGKIKKARDIYTHSSSEVESELDAIELSDIAVLYKYIYRINILLRLGVKQDLLIKRLKHCRSFIYYLEKYFETELVNTVDSYLAPSDFDSKMWFFSDRMKRKFLLE